MNNLINSKDYYEILELDESATIDDIKKSYENLALKNHPDRGGDKYKFQEISEAYQILCDPDKKIEYDNIKKYSNNKLLMNYQFRNPEEVFNNFFDSFANMHISSNPFNTQRINNIFQNLQNTYPDNISFNKNVETIFSGSKKIEKTVEIINGLKTETIIETDLISGEKKYKTKSILLRNTIS